MAKTIKHLRAASDDDLIEAHDEVASYHRLGRLPDEDRGDGGGAIAVTGISRELSVIVLGTALSRWLKSGAAQLGLEPPL